VLPARPHRALDSTGPGAGRHRGLSCLLVPVRQPGIKIRAIMQITGTAEFNEVFFDDARTAAGTWRASQATAGGSRSACSASNAASPISAS